MLRIQRALLLELGLVLLVVVGVITAVLFSGLSINLMAQAGEAAGTALLGELLPSLLPTALAYSLPFGWLVAVSLVVGRWVNDHEVTSLRAAGVHVRTLALPVVALSAVLTLVGLGISLYVVPDAQHAVREATRGQLHLFLASLRDVNRSVTLGNGRMSFRAFEGGVFRDVELDRRDGDGRLETKALARSLDLKQITRDEGSAGLSIELRDGYVLQSVAGGEAALTPAGSTVIHLAKVEALGGSTQFNSYFGLPRYLAGPRDLNLPSLIYVRLYGGAWRAQGANLEEAIHGRLVQGCAPLVLGCFALGVALLLPPTGRRVRDFLVAFVPATLLFYPLHLGSRGLSAALPFPIWVGMWAPVMVVGPLALGLLLWAGRR